MNKHYVNCPNFKWITHIKLNAWAVALISLCVAVISAIMSGALMLMLPYGDPEILVGTLKVYIILLPVSIFLVRDFLKIIAFLLFGDTRLNRIIFAYPFAGSGIFSRPNHLLRINGYKSCLIFFHRHYRRDRMLEFVDISILVDGLSRGNDNWMVRWRRMVVL